MIEHIQKFPKHIQNSLKNIKEDNLNFEEVGKVVIAAWEVLLLLD